MTQDHLREALAEKLLRKHCQDVDRGVIHVSVDDARRAILAALSTPSPAITGDGLREALKKAGWSVAVHNDYRLDGKSHTFWLFTHPNGRWAKGEGETDEEALRQVTEASLMVAPQGYQVYRDRLQAAFNDYTKTRDNPLMNWNCRCGWVSNNGPFCGYCGASAPAGTETAAELKRQRDGYRLHLMECEQIAGKALGYPWYKDDQKNFPGATKEDGVCIGEHVGDTIVKELASSYKAEHARAELAALKIAELEAVVKGGTKNE